MKYTLMTLLISTMTWAVNLDCDLNQRFVFRTNFGAETFDSARLSINNLEDDLFRTTITVEERFGAGFIFYNRFFDNPVRCSDQDVCLGTELGGFNGMTFRIPKSVLSDESTRNFVTIRVIDEQARRTAFANCRVIGR